MFQKTMDEFQQDHELLREEVNHLKIHMGMVMETLQVLLKNG